MVVLREPVGFVAQILQQFQPHMVPFQPNRFDDALHVNQFLLFRERNDLGGSVVHGLEHVHGRIELPDTAVDQDQIGVKLIPTRGLAITPADDFLN